MTTNPETTTLTIDELVSAKLERQERASTPTLRDLRKAALDLALGGAFATQPSTDKSTSGQSNTNFRQVR